MCSSATKPQPARPTLIFFILGCLRLSRSGPHYTGQAGILHKASGRLTPPTAASISAVGGNEPGRWAWAVKECCQSVRVVKRNAAAGLLLRRPAKAAAKLSRFAPHI